jgi:hypothetical protein
LTNCIAGWGLAIEDADLRTFFQKARCGGGTDATGASGDEDAFVFESTHEKYLRFPFLIQFSGSRKLRIFLTLFSSNLILIL